MAQRLSSWLEWLSVFFLDLSGSASVFLDLSGSVSAFFMTVDLGGSVSVFFAT